MSEEVQERFEDYLELEQYIEQLHLPTSAHPPANLTPQQMSVYSMAMLFHSASPHVADPRPEFKEQLRQRLLAQVQSEDKRQRVETEQATVGTGLAPVREEGARVDQTGPNVPATNQRTGASPIPTERPNPVPTEEQSNGRRRIYSNKRASQPDKTSSTHQKSTNAQKTRAAGTGLASLPRRTLLTGGTLAAASLLGATAIGGAIEHSLESQPNTTPPDHSPLLTNVPATWYPVTTVDQLGKDAIRFTTDTMVGYVIRQTVNSNGANPAPTEQIVAFSAICTHRGCIVQWQEDTRQFLCPCHNGAFDATGNPIYIQKGLLYLAPLAPLDTKIENGHIYVKVPLPPTQESNW